MSLNLELSFSLAGKSDLPAIYALEQQCFAGHCYPDFFFRQALDCWPEGLIVSKDLNGQVKGYLLASSTHNPNEAWILSIAVIEEARGMGIGSQLISQLLSQLPAQVKQVKLTVAPDNPAKALYLRHGFVEQSYEADYFGEGEPRLVLSYSRA